MARVLSSNMKKQVKAAVFAKADAFCYAGRSRNENGRFIDELVEDPEIGLVLKDYIPGEKVRTYIKDGVLNAYTKEKTKQILETHDPLSIVRTIYSVEAAFIQRQDAVTVFRSTDNRVFVISQGTVLKWETALRKALELIARSPGLMYENKYPEICIQLAVINGDITDGDVTQIKSALAAVGVQVAFSKN